MTSTRFVFEVIGTRGDVVPLLAVAAELRRRGHDATLLAASVFAQEARALDVDFVPITDRHLDVPRGQNSFDSFYFPAFQPVVDYFERAVPAGQRLVVINIDHTATSNLICERQALPGIRLYLYPLKVRSLVAPPWPFAAKGPAALRQFYAACDHHPGLLAYCNERRHSLGLGDATSAAPEEPHLVRQACLFPDWYCPPAADWPANVAMLGFPLPAPRAPLPEEVSRFLAAGTAPIVFTTGTGVQDVSSFFAAARDCCARLGRRGILLSPFAPRPSEPDSAVLQQDFVELGALLQHSALLVHHGGIGTMARALQAGIPQIITPLKYDQPDNARRIEGLGLGARLDRSRLSGAALAELSERLLQSPALANRIAAAAQRIQQSSAIEDCASLIERAGKDVADRESRDLPGKGSPPYGMCPVRGPARPASPDGVILTPARSFEAEPTCLDDFLRS